MPASFWRRVWVTLSEGRAYFSGRRGAYVVEGRSMLPTLTEGDRVFTRKTARAQPGEIVVAQLHGGRRVVKRVASRGNATVSLSSDNPNEGRDGRHLGSLADDQVLGVVVLTWPWRS